MKTRNVLVPLVAGISLCLGLLALLSGRPTPVAAAPNRVVRYVRLTGSDSGACTDVVSPCRTLQYAVDQASSGDEILVAAGTYTDVAVRGGLAQVVYLSKTVNLHGGYAPDFTARDAAAFSTTLDAQGRGRGLVIQSPAGSAQPIRPLVEGLYVTGGDATEQGGDSAGEDAGGGVYVHGAAPTISGCVVHQNVASTNDYGYGGGLYLRDSGGLLQDNEIRENTATTYVYGHGYGGAISLQSSDIELRANTVISNVGGAWYAYGGGLYLRDSGGLLQENELRANTASTGQHGEGHGGGIHLRDSDTELRANRIVSNVGSVAWYGHGGGMYALYGAPMLRDNTIAGNTASVANYGTGGGLDLRRLHARDAAVVGNTLRANVASESGTGYGGGIYVMQYEGVIEQNVVWGNTASTVGSGRGGGVYLRSSGTVLDGNTISGNKASGEGHGLGGGIAVWESVGFRFVNNVVAMNRASGAGSGLWLVGQEVDVSGHYEPTSGHVLHTSIVDNGPVDAAGDSGQGVYVGDVTNVWFTNTIIVGHRNVGLVAGAGGAAVLEGTLWHDNGTETAGSGSVDIGSVNVYTDPLFVDPAAGDYHLALGSPAIDAGVAADVSRDMDGDARPHGQASDLGADEYPIAPPVGGATRPLALTAVRWPWGLLALVGLVMSTGVVILKRLQA